MGCHVTCGCRVVCGGTAVHFGGSACWARRLSASSSSTLSSLRGSPHTLKSSQAKPAVHANTPSTVADIVQHHIESGRLKAINLRGRFALTRRTIKRCAADAKLVHVLSSIEFNAGPHPAAARWCGRCTIPARPLRRSCARRAQYAGAHASGRSERGLLLHVACGTEHSLLLATAPVQRRAHERAPVYA